MNDQNNIDRHHVICTFFPDKNSAGLSLLFLLRRHRVSKYFIFFTESRSFKNNPVATQRDCIELKINESNRDFFMEYESLV